MDGYFLGEENGIVNTGLVYVGTFFLGLPDAYVGILFDEGCIVEHYSGKAV